MGSTEARTQRELRAPRVGLAIFALAIGGFAIGTTEFISMGLLPELAEGTGVSIPVAGHYISAYAAGVVVGAPLIAALTASMPRKQLLVLLMTVFALANAASALPDTYLPLMVVRFLSGLPHGAYFGIAGLVATRLVAPERRTWAVSMVLIGLGAANIVGVPLGTVLGQQVGWQAPFIAVGVIGAICVASMFLWVPPDHEGGASSLGAELGALTRLQVWLALLMGTVGFGGMFATFSYISPTMTQISGFPESFVPVILAIYGVGMTAGMAIAGRISQLGIMRGIVICLVIIAILLAVFGVVIQVKGVALLAVLALGFFPSILVPLLQTRLMDVAADGQNLAAALNHSTLNIANALGAWLGSMVLLAGLGYEWPSRVGALLAVGGLVVAVISIALERLSAQRAADRGV